MSVRAHKGVIRDRLMAVPPHQKMLQALAPRGDLMHLQYDASVTGAAFGKPGANYNNNTGPIHIETASASYAGIQPAYTNPLESITLARPQHFDAGETVAALPAVAGRTEAEVVGILNDLGYRGGEDGALLAATDVEFEDADGGSDFAKAGSVKVTAAKDVYKFGGGDRAGGLYMTSHFAEFLAENSSRAYKDLAPEFAGPGYFYGMGEIWGRQSDNINLQSDVYRTGPSRKGVVLVRVAKAGDGKDPAAGVTWFSVNDAGDAVIAADDDKDRFVAVDAGIFDGVFSGVDAVSSLYTLSPESAGLDDYPFNQGDKAAFEVTATAADAAVAKAADVVATNKLVAIQNGAVMEPGKEKRVQGYYERDEFMDPARRLMIAPGDRLEILEAIYKVGTEFISGEAPAKAKAGASSYSLSHIRRTVFSVVAMGYAGTLIAAENKPNEWNLEADMSGVLYLEKV